MPRSRRIGLLALAALILVSACSRGADLTSFDPGQPCTADGRYPGAYPDLEAQVPRLYMSSAPETLDSGRNCTAANLGTLADKGITEVRFAGGTWTFGAERAAVLAIFSAPGLDATALAGFYAQSAQAAARTTITGQTTPLTAGRPGYRLDTETGERTQSVVVWPASTAGVVNVVITDDLPDARIQDAIDAFGGPLMFRFLIRHGLVRVVGGRLVPALMVWDLAVLANKTRRIPIGDRGLRRGASAARDGVGSVVRGRSGRTRRREARRRRTERDA